MSAVTIHSVPSSNPITTITETLTNSGQQLSQSLKGLQLAPYIYKGSYALSYGIVFTVVFVAYLFPKRNPIGHGLVDGARAAIDEHSQQRIIKR